MRRDVWEEVGGFDDGYFLWYDDVDLAKRLVDRRRRNLIVGAVTLMLGTGDFTLKFGEFSLGGIGTATFGAILLNAVLSGGRR